MLRPTTMFYTAAFRVKEWVSGSRTIMCRPEFECDSQRVQTACAIYNMLRADARSRKCCQVRRSFLTVALFGC